MQVERTCVHVSAGVCCSRACAYPGQHMQLRLGCMCLRRLLNPIVCSCACARAHAWVCALKRVPAAHCAQHLRSINGEVQQERASGGAPQHSAPGGGHGSHPARPFTAAVGGAHAGDAARRGVGSGSAVALGPAGRASAQGGGRGGAQQPLHANPLSASPSDSVLSKDDPVVEEPSHSRWVQHGAGALVRPAAEQLSCSRR